MSLAPPFTIDSPNLPPALKGSAVSATNYNGETVVAWVQQNVTKNGTLQSSEVMAQLFKPNGTPDGPEIVAAASAGYNSYDPAVAIDPENEYVVSWTQQEPNGNTFVLAQKFNYQSVAVGNVVPVGVGTFYQSQSSVAMDAYGDFVVAYTRDTNDNNPDVFAKAYYINEQLRSVITVAASPKAESNPKIAMDDVGNFDIAYQVQNGSTSAVYVARYSKNDALLGVTSVTTGSASDDLPSIAMDYGDDAVVAYRELISPNFDDVDATKINGATGAIEAKIFVGAYGPPNYNFIYASVGNTGEGPAVAFQPNGDYFAVAYTEFDRFPFGNEELNVGVVGPGPSYTVDTWFVGSWLYDPSITTEGSGGFLVTYLSNPTPGTPTPPTYGWNNHVIGQQGTYS